MRRTTIVILLLVAALLTAGGYALLPEPIAPEVIERSVVRSPDRLEEAWALPVASRFDRRLVWQSNGSLCGPASLANVNRSLGEPGQTESAILAGTGRCLTGFCILGLTLDEVAEIARAKSARRVAVLRDLSLEEFRGHMRASNDSRHRYIANFDRKRIFGAGVGHHSPIGGYLETEDLVLVLDLNPRFGPWLIASARLFDAIDTLDGNRKRGLLLIE